MKNSNNNNNTLKEYDKTGIYKDQEIEIEKWGTLELLTCQ